MNIIFVSNYYNHHQAALCQALENQCERFVFIATGEMRAERKIMGYDQIQLPDFVVKGYGDVQAIQYAKDLINNADVVIAGSAPEYMLRERIRKGKLLFRYSERPFKKDLSLVRFLKNYILMNIRNPRNKPIYLLCASAYTALDYSRVGLFKNKAYKWGYFPETVYYDSIERLIHQKDKSTILWVGRLIDWKHPEHAVYVAHRLKNGGYSFRLNIIGTGAMWSQLEQMISDFQLEDCVSLLGVMPPNQVRKHMEKAGIFLFTSDKQEGWGAVLNEAMNSGCAVVASYEIGAAPYLISDIENGLIYKSGDIDALYEKAKGLLDAPDRQAELGQCAYTTITELWNARIAADRFIEITKSILAGANNFNTFESGPCSIARMRSDRASF